MKGVFVLIPAINLKNITKKFGNLTANDSVNFSALPGEIHGICGENGAGKTTLMNVLYGLYIPDSGSIEVNGNQVSFHSSKDAIDCNIGMVHQHFSLVPSLTVYENIVMGNPPKTPFGTISKKNSVKVVNRISKEYGLSIDPLATVKDLPVGLQQRVEIIKALYLGADVLILDEPTAVLTPQEIDHLFITLNEMKILGKTVILITHKLNEVKNITDRVTVMRRGKVIGSVNTFSVSEEDIAKMMVGREIINDFPKVKTKTDAIVLDVDSISCNNDKGLRVVDSVSFNLKKGEIVGLAGVQGNGQTELIEAITGLRKVIDGEVRIKGNVLNGSNLPALCRSLGLSHIPEDRLNVGAAINASIVDNFLIDVHNDDQFSKYGFLDKKKINLAAENQLVKFDVRYSSIFDRVGTLSGGNIQKLIIAREMYLDPELIIAAQPTRGLDIGASEFVHKQLIDYRNNGDAVLLISYELSEILSLSDRIIVIYNGRIIGEIEQSDATEEQLGLWMAGITNNKNRSAQ